MPCNCFTVATVVGDWSQWSRCSVTCGLGEKSRRRACTQGNDGLSCPPRLSERVRCRDRECPRLPGIVEINVLMVSNEVMIHFSSFPLYTHYE